MSDFDALKSKYFVQSGDANPPSEPMPPEFDKSTVSHLINVTSYCSVLSTELDKIGNASDNSEDFIYISSWLLCLTEYNKYQPFALDGRGGSNRLLDILKSKARVGVDVRVLGWVNRSLVEYPVLPGWRDINIQTIKSIQALREEESLRARCCLNTLGHLLGCVHPKMVIVGNRRTGATGFTGSIDFRDDRYNWHEIQAMIKGPTVQSLFDLFYDMWQEVISHHPRSIRVDYGYGETEVMPVNPGTQDIPGFTLPTDTSGNHYVQSLRTIPKIKSSTSSLIRSEPISFDVEGQGVFQMKLAWRKAILAAEKYIYIEFAQLWSQDVMQWIKETIRNPSHLDLKVILVTGKERDPGDPIVAYFQAAVYKALLPGLLTSHIDRIRLFKRQGKFIHAKTMLIDDRWAMIGSANHTRRSLYTDLEHSIAIMDKEDTYVKKYRCDLWGEHFGLADSSTLLDLSHALNVWNPKWGTPGGGLTLPSYFETVSLDSLPEEEWVSQIRYNLCDPDSRKSLGDLYEELVLFSSQ
jgi:phosphatidylserine/phosphatidylglycerophosphate/cardiolipin synthase-like enzyme